MYTKSLLLYPFEFISSKYLSKEDVQYRVSQKFAPLILCAKIFDRNLCYQNECSNNRNISLKHKRKALTCVVVFTYKQFMT